MGYQTDFIGRFDLDKELTPELEKELVEFAEERHGGNTQPYEGYPGFWCQWVPADDRKGIEWDGGEKFYNYVEWIELIIEKFLKPNGYTLNGVVDWVGEETDDTGAIVVDNNVVSTRARGTDGENATRLFFVVDSPADNEEIFETLEQAETHMELNRLSYEDEPRIRVCIVQHAYREDNGSWNYDDLSDTFTVLATQGRDF